MALTDVDLLVGHASAVDELIEDIESRIADMTAAQAKIVTFTNTPMKAMAMQGLQRAIVRLGEARMSLIPYSRTLRTYVGQFGG
jgi:hypothetical protein